MLSPPVHEQTTSKKRKKHTSYKDMMYNATRSITDDISKKKAHKEQIARCNGGGTFDKLKERL